MNNLLKTIEILRQFGVKCEQYKNKAENMTSYISISSDIFNMKKEQCSIRLCFDNEYEKITHLYIAKGPAVFNDETLRLIRKMSSFKTFDRDNIFFNTSNYKNIVSDILNLSIYIKVNEIKTISKGKSLNKSNINKQITYGELKQKIEKSKMNRIFEINASKKDSMFFEKVSLNTRNARNNDLLIKSIGVMKNKNKIALQIGSWNNISYANLNFKYLSAIRNMKYYEGTRRDLAIFKTNDIDQFLDDLYKVVTKVKKNKQGCLY